MTLLMDLKKTLWISGMTKIETIRLPTLFLHKKTDVSLQDGWTTDYLRMTNGRKIL